MSNCIALMLPLAAAACIAELWRKMLGVYGFNVGGLWF